MELNVHLRRSQNQSYTIHLGSGSVSVLDVEFERFAETHGVALISDRNVYALYGSKLERSIRKRFSHILTLLVPAGERSKSRWRKASIEDAMIREELGRDSLVIALGGGVVGDLAGYVAATYLRGLPYVQVPTTLLAQVDSSIGGKVAINTKAGKNLVGAFHQPVAVLADIDFLSTLPKRQFLSGLSELIKHGIIADRHLFEQLEENLDRILDMDVASLTQALYRSMAVKAKVVQKDEKEGGLRKILNWGHTLGHAVEALSNYRLLHGECVSIGMALEARLCRHLGWLSRQDEQREILLLQRAGLPIQLPAGISGHEVVKKTQIDKKARAGHVRYLVHDKIGSMSSVDGTYTVQIPSSEVLACLS